MPALPPPEKQEWLLESLAQLVKRMGAERLLSATLVRPVPEHFPDPWAPDLRGVEAMLRRLQFICFA